MFRIARPILAFLTLLLAPEGGRTAPAPTLFFCLSVRIEPATVNALGQHRLAFNYSDTASENGELGIVDEVESPDFLRGTGFTLTAPFLGVPVTGDMYFDIPQLDANRNAIDDIFEVSQVQPLKAQNGRVAYKTIDDEQLEGTVIARWQRPAGATRGTVQIRIDIPGYTQTFTHNFEVFQYAGEMTYTKNGSNVVAEVSLTRQGAAGSLKGSWNLVVQTNDSLFQRDGAWVPGMPKIKFEPTNFDNDFVSYDLLRGGLGNNFFGTFQYNEGSPVDPTPLDYAQWQIDIQDPNDIDGDRIPDLIDFNLGGVIPPAAIPGIVLGLTNQIAALTLTGTPGRDYVIEHRDSLEVGTWTPTSTNQPAANGSAVVVLPVMAVKSVRFWRARVR